MKLYIEKRAIMLVIVLACALAFDWWLFHSVMKFFQ